MDEATTKLDHHEGRGPGEREVGDRASEPPPSRQADSEGAPFTPIENPSTWTILRGIVRSVRPHQWVKNTFVLAPMIFAHELTNLSIAKRAVGAFGTFCLLAGAIYTLNDLLDVEADRVHPVKRFRPIASGAVPVGVAKALIAVLMLVALGGAALGPWQFLAVAVGYFVLQTAYSLRLKRIAYVDVGCIAAGFVLRVLAGFFAIQTPKSHAPISLYMIACTAFLALFLGFGKRRHELTGANAKRQRKALEAYSARALFWALTISGLAAVGTYLAYTLDAHTERFFRSEWLWLTTIHPLIGVLRFLQLVRDRPRAESPTQEMLRDVPFMLNLVVWVIEVIAIVYRLRLS
ncbi:MAG: decaprenyl-phosphate phosphoribosyltransferase [Myxococcales bacterium]|nr:decaprenyl-phosphate phosphoribosyltransferase [Myxococcales bacterium]